LHGDSDEVRADISCDLRHALDPVAWVDENKLLRDKRGNPVLLDPKQQQILTSPQKRIIVNCHRQWGKSTISSLLCLHRAIFYPKSLCLLVAPSLRQSSENFRKVLDSLDLTNGLDLQEDTKLSLVLANGSRILALPGSQKTIRGFSAPDLIVVDEDAQAEDELYGALLPMLTSNPAGRIILASTPWGRRGHFYQIWTQGGPEWLKIKVIAPDNPRLDPAILEEARNGPNGALWFQQEYMGEFVSDEFNIFDEDRINKALSSDFEEINAEVY
jgi:hypothetical protein